MFSFPRGVYFKFRQRTQNEGARGMATLKAISVRLKSVKNIQKITQSMKMVSAAKYARAERELKLIKPMGQGVKQFYIKAEIGSYKQEQPPAESKEKPKKYLYIAVTSDRGLCGTVHSSVARLIRNALQGSSENVKIVCIGDKSRTLLHRVYGNNILFVCQEVGRTPPTFKDASKIAREILHSEFEYDEAKIVFNKFRSVVSNVTETLSFFTSDTVMKAKKLDGYEDADEETLLSFVEFSIVTMIFYAMKEATCSEQSSRMTAMDNASKNAGEMIHKLTLTFNRTRQTVITRELIEIISGASAL